MGVQNATILKGASVSFTGGTSVPLKADSVPVKGGIHLVDTTVTDYSTRPNMFLQATSPGYSPTDKSYSNAKKSFKAYFPKALSDGQVKAPSIEIIIRDNPCQTAAEVQAMVDCGLQFLADSDFAEFRTLGAIA